MISHVQNSSFGTEEVFIAQEILDNFALMKLLV